MPSMSPAMAQVLAEAAARRQDSAEASSSSAHLMQEHEQRQMFRRLIDPGIFRPNSKEVAMGSLKTLSTMAENILREPENPKYQSFKRENDTIKRRLIQPKGALEYALALGFSPKVLSFQSYYAFNPSRMANLRVGAAILRETLDRETEKEERERRNREQQKAAVAAAAQNVKLAFLDDRRTKTMHDKRERELREAREARRSQGAAASLVLSPERDEGLISMPGVGHTLSGVYNDADQPPPYNG